MKDNYNIKVNPPDLSSDQIAQHQDFDALFAQFEKTVTPPSEEQAGVAETPIVAIGTGGKSSGWLAKYVVGGLITIAAAVLLVFMMQNMVLNAGGEVPAGQMEELLALQAPMSDFEKQFSNMVVNSAEKGETLEYHSGSKIIVPASAFVDEKGAPVKGKVDIQYREFNDHVDMFLAGVPKELDKHQNLQSVGMMEIKGFQDGKPVYLSMDKTLEVELKGQIAGDIPTTDLGVYVYSKKQDAWDYSAADQVEVIASTEEQPINSDDPPTGMTAEEIRAQVQTNLASTKPKRPIEPGVPENMQIFDFDIDRESFPDLAAYDENVEFMVAKDEINDKTYDYEWNSMNIEGLGNDTYKLTLTREVNGVNTPFSWTVYPAIRASELAREEYKEALVAYHKEKDAWDQDVAAAIEQYTAGSDIAATTVMKDIINRFTVNRFGLWNCGKTIEMQEALQIEANFVDEGGMALTIDKLFISNKDRQLYYFSPNETNASKATLKFDTQAKNVIWALTKDNELLVATIDEVAPKEGALTFQMKAAGLVESEEDVRKLLTI